MMSSKNHNAPNPKNNSTENLANVPTSNRFGALSDQSEEEMECTTSQRNPTAEPEKKNSPRLPPIIITQKFSNLSLFHKEMKKILKGQYHVKYSPGEIKLFIKTQNDYNAALESLKVNKIQRYSYAQKGEKSKKIVLKTACFVSEEEIKNQLNEQLNLQNNQLEIIKMKGRNSKSTSCLISTSQDTDIKKLKNLHE
ncbi:hypothetical protein WA026_010216 [Henosepilachna vigintioctopunctata]|uniref:Pre-C2HC domain-containing protein n=1 Tax=Henosepilachna vigintioctopunctata TaxID=420089 RepID=A0AAW1U9L4_9CUCU